MRRDLIAAVLVLIIFLTLLPVNVGAEVNAEPELYRCSIFAFQFNCFAIKADNSLWGWGYNTNSPYNPGFIIPNSTQDFYLTPVKVADDVLTVGVNDLCTFILKTSGELWGWGSNFDGALAQNMNVNESRKPIKILEDVIDIKTTGTSMGAAYTVVLKKDGTLWHWGEKWSKDYWDIYTPSLLMENVAALCNRNYAIKKDGTMWELAPLDSAGATLRPQEVELTQDAQNSNILYSNAYIKPDGSLWRWGSNRYGEVTEVGAGESMFTEDVPIEYAKKKLEDVVFYDSSMAIKKDGSLWTWGYNEYGAMGKGDDSGEFYTTSGWSYGGEDFKGLPYYTTPVKIMEDVVFCANGGANGLAVKKDGSLWSWGRAYYGMVGNGSLRTGLPKEEKGQEFYPVPQKIMDDIRVTND